MNPKILAAGTLSFLICLTAHILRWRFRRPRNDILALIVIFMLIPGSAAIFYCFWMIYAKAAGWAMISNLSAFLIFHLALSSAYIQSYPPAQAISPSLEMMILVHRAMPGGLTQAEISGCFNNDMLVHTRFIDLVNTGLIAENNGVFTLTASGKRLIGFFVIYRKTLGLEFKGG